MSWKPTITALILAIVAAGGAYVIWRTDRTERTADARHIRVLAEGKFPAARIDRITLERQGQATMTFQRAPGGGPWVQTEPLEIPVDQFSIQQFVDLAADLHAVDVIDPGRTPEEDVPAAFGFSPPQAVVTYQWPDGELQLEIGGRMFAGRGYVRRAGTDLIHVVDQALSDRAVAMDAREWRDRSIFSLAAQAPRRIVREAGGRRMVLELQGRLWKMIEPSATRVDELTMDGFIAGLVRARCSGFIADLPDDLSRFGLDRPAGSLEIETEGEPSSPQRLLIGAAVGLGAEDRFAMIEGRPLVVQISQAVLTALFQPPEIFVEPLATGANPADIKSIRVHLDRPAETASGADDESADFQLERDLERWIAPEHGNLELPATPIDDLLKLLTEVRAEEIAFRPMPREAQIGFITLFGFDGSPRDTVRLARDPDSGKWWLDNGDDVLRIYPASMDLKLAPRDFGLPAAP